MAEAFVISDAAGADRQAVYDVMSAGPLHSSMMDFVKGYAIDGDANQLAFSIANAAKDLGYYYQMAKDAGADPLIARGALDALRAATDGGQGEQMASQMVDFYAQRAKK